MSYQKSFFDKIKNDVTAALKNGAHPVAAFDADGTLWDTDLGENFFQYKIDNNLVALPPNPWKHYHDWQKHDRPAAYLWLAQILEGQSLAQIRQWAQQALNVYPHGVPVFVWMKDLIQFLKAEGVRVYIVTASIRWAVEPAAKLFDLTYEEVIGVETEVVNGIVTAKAAGTMTYREGKAQALLKATSGHRPVLCAGNSTGDTNLLRLASHVALVNVSRHSTATTNQQEFELKQIALREGWPVWEYG